MWLFLFRRVAKISFRGGGGEQDVDGVDMASGVPPQKI